MTALTKDRNTPKKIGQKKAIPMAADTKIFGGSIVCSNADGYAVPGADTAGLKFEGIAKEYVDNTDGNNGDVTVTVEQPSIIQLTAAGMTQADRGKPAYISDDQTISLSTTNGICCGVIREVESATKVWVDTFYLLVAKAQAAITAEDANAAAGEKVTTAEATAAAGDNPTKAEFDAVVTLINEMRGIVMTSPNKTEYDAVVTEANATKTAVNSLLTTLKNARLMGS